MAPGPASSQLPSGSGSGSVSASESASATSTTSAVPPDLKHCAGCGQQLESAIVTDPHQAGGDAQRIITVGSHAFVVRPPQVTPDVSALDSTAESSLHLTDEQGRTLCQACGEAARAARVVAEEQAATTDHAMDVDEQEPRENASPMELTTPPSTSIGGASSPRVRDMPAQAEAIAPYHRPHGRIERSHSFSRSQVTHSVSGDDAHPLSMRDGSLSTVVPIVSVPASSSSSGGHSSPSTSTASTTRSRAMPARIGPSSMTRPRLSDYPPSTHRSHSPSASRILGNPLKAPYRERTTEQAAAPLPVTWFDPLRPDPLMDISRLRTPPRGRGCLYPGALFNGTQKSGKLSYDVTVEILNVDLPNSHLDGYLNIRGLTEDWPELTTFFTAEIIGMEHDFITGRWGAQEADDLKHWSRFSPFNALHRSLAGKDPRGGGASTTTTGMRFNHLNKPYVFMRWKERFLVPDWRVRDISGASFAGFYYVCAEFGDMSEWMMGSVDPSKTLLGQSAKGTADAVRGASQARPPTQSHSPTDSRDSSPRRAARRRLGSQQVDLQGIATNELYSLATSTAGHVEEEDGTRTSVTAAANLAATVAMIRNIRGVQGERRSRTVDSAADANGERTERSAQPRSAQSSIGASPLSRFRRPMPPEISEAGGGGGDSGVQLPRVSINERELEIEQDEDEEEQQQQTTTPASASAGKITAFYYHENSEPYQQLDLRHVPQRCLGAFEMR